MTTRCIVMCDRVMLDIWPVAAPHILKFIRVNEYNLIVPDVEVEIFRDKTPSIYKITPESFYIKYARTEFNFCSLLNWEGVNGLLRKYLIELAALSVGRAGDVNLLWNCNSIPLREINLFDDHGRIKYYRRRHNDGGRLQSAAESSATTRIQNGTGSTQLMCNNPMRVEWARQYQNEFIKIDPTEWATAQWPVRPYSESHSSGISDSLEQFVLQNWSNAIVIREESYLSEGSKLVGRALDIYNPDWADLASWIDFVEFRDRGTGRFRGLQVGCGGAVLEHTFQGGEFLNCDINQYRGSMFEFDITKKWPFPSQFFEHIVANNVLEHLESITKTFREIDRCLAPGGFLQIEVPFVGSYNHGTDVTHVRGMTFESFNFLCQGGQNYLFQEERYQEFNYECITFYREIILDGQLRREVFSEIPERGTYQEWIALVREMIIPGTIGFLFRKNNGWAQ